jgi:hypothetical protein
VHFEWGLGGMKEKKAKKDGEENWKCTFFASEKNIETKGL